MDKLRRSFRDSFRKKKEHIPESSKPHQWQSDEGAVRGGTCSFHVKYLGCVEVYESRGMQICEEALKVLRSSRRRPERGMLYVSGDGLRFVDDDTKGLIVDQTIEKVSFCAPDRNHERGFSYICRDGTTRRWMCHGFLASRDTGERLSHAVGCAFAVCLEKKQKRDEKCGVTMTFDNSSSTFTRKGSFRTLPVVERCQDPEDEQKMETPAPSRNVVNPFAIERPHATPLMLQRQNSFRGFSTLNQQSPFKRQLSLRLNDLPSTLDRQRGPDPGSSPIPEGQVPSPIHPDNAVSLLAQQVSQGLSLLASVADSQGLDSPTSNTLSKGQDDQLSSVSPDNNPWSGMTAPGWSPPFKSMGQNPPGSVPIATVQPTPMLPPVPSEITKLSKADEWLSNTVKLPPAPSPAPRKNPPVSVKSQSLQARPAMNPFSGPDWLQQSTANSQPPSNPFSQNTVKAFEVHM